MSLGKVAVVGSGLIGGTVARLAVGAGWRVVLANSRGPASLRPLVDVLGASASAASASEAVRVADLVVVAVPVHAYPDLPRGLPGGQVVMDTGNYSPQRDGVIADLSGGLSGGLPGAWLARLVPGARVVKAFNTIHHEHLATLPRPAGAADRSALPVAGDDAAALAVVVSFLDTLGFDAVPVGGLSEEWRLTPGRPAFGLPYSGGAPSFSDAPATPAGIAAVSAAVDAASKKSREQP